jgi:NAD(P)-dependent dehydrogenase (short-subunit alcohol dehydrogenase family)
LSNPAAAPRRVLVTGAASGIGLATARQLARQGDHVIVADRNVVGGEAVVRAIVADGGRAEFRELDLADLKFIRAFAHDELARKLPLHVLINNAGLLPPMTRATTRDGFELEFGVAHLGHFALTGLLLPALRRSPRPRVVSVASIAHAQGRIDLDDLQSERKYLASTAYGNTKLACLMFALELDRRARAAGSDLVSVAAHPGIAATAIGAGWDAENRRGLIDRLERISFHLAIGLFGKTPAEGALPLVYAASEASVAGGGYYGPAGFMQIRGGPGRVQPRPHALDPAVGAALWERSGQLTGVRYEF